jgi:transposase-like protein
VSQEGSLREGLEAAIRERVRELIEMVLEQEVESALGASRHQRVAERSGYRHGRKSRRLTLRTGTVHVGVPRARLVDALRHVSQLYAIRDVSQNQLEAVGQKIVTGREVVVNDDLISLPLQQPCGVTTDIACSANN